MINCYSLLSFRFLCFSCLPEKSQHLHFLKIKTLFLLIDFYTVNLLPRVSCYMAMWLNSLQPTPGSEQMLALKLHMENSASSRPFTAQSPPQQRFPKFTRPILRQWAKVHRGKSPASQRNHPGPGSGVWEELQVTEPVSSLELCTERRGSWRLSSARQAALLKDALN